MVDSFDNNHIPDQVRFAWGKELGLKVYRLHCTMFETWALTWPVCSASKGATKLIGWWTLSINCISFNFKASYVKGNFHSLVDFQEKWMLGASAVCCLHMHRSLAWRGLFMNFGSWSPMQNKSSCVLTFWKEWRRPFKLKEACCTHLCSHTWSSWLEQEDLWDCDTWLMKSRHGWTRLKMDKNGLALRRLALWST